MSNHANKIEVAVKNQALQFMERVYSVMGESFDLSFDRALLDNIMRMTQQQKLAFSERTDQPRYATILADLAAHDDSQQAALDASILNEIWRLSNPKNPFRVGADPVTSNDKGATISAFILWLYRHGLTADGIRDQRREIHPVCRNNIP